MATFISNHLKGKCLNSLHHTILSGTNNFRRNSHARTVLSEKPKRRQLPKKGFVAALWDTIMRHCVLVNNPNAPTNTILLTSGIDNDTKYEELQSSQVYIKM